MSEEAPHTLFEKIGRIGLITLNRPEKLNAWTDEMRSEVKDHVLRCDADPAIGAIVITGAGRGFCAGRDLGRANARQESAEQLGTEASRVMTTAYTIPELLHKAKPIVAGVNGAAVGLGLTLSLACDVRIASDQARFSARFVRVGLTPELSSSFLLPQTVGLANAAELMLTGRIIDADEALRIGLVNRVVPHEQLMDAVLALAGEIAFNPVMPLRWTKQLLYANVTNSNPVAVQLAEETILSEASRGPAAREAATAFLEKRDPDFRQFDE